MGIRSHEVDVLDAIDDFFEDDEEKNLLIGNGFTRAHPVFGEFFEYDSLLEKSLLNHRVASVFRELGSSNFEEILKSYDDCLKLINIYSSPIVSNQMTILIQKDSGNIKRDFVNTITAIHPPSAISLTVPHVISCSEFVRLFDQIFTTNYDLLLYWVINIQNLTSRFTDGFTTAGNNPLHWDPEVNGQNLHFLHGGLHLYSLPNGEIKKIVFSQTPIIEQLQTNISNNQYPLVVLEGSSIQKMQAINRNDYLDFCYRSLRSMTGNLLIYGMSFQFDIHLLARILQSNLKSIYFSLYGSPQQQQHAAQTILATISGLTSNPKPFIFFVDSNVFNVW